MNYLQSLSVPKQNTQLNSASRKQTGQVQGNNTGLSKPLVPRSSEISVRNAEMMQVWVSGGSVVMPKARVAPKNAGKQLDLLG